MRARSRLAEGSVRLNQVVARIAKQLCLADAAKAFSHWLLEVGIASSRLSVQEVCQTFACDEKF
jgi:hypothetical protein